MAQALGRLEGALRFSAAGVHGGVEVRDEGGAFVLRQMIQAHHVAVAGQPLPVPVASWKV